MPRLIVDVETYPNYFCVCAQDVETGKRWLFEGQDYDRTALQTLMRSHTIVTFNGNSFDVPMIGLSFYRPDLTESELSLAAVSLINGCRRSELFERYEIPAKAMSKVDHIDLIEVAFGKASLKLYAGRLHAPRLRDLPYDPGSRLTEGQKADVLRYCWNDVANTLLLYRELENQIALRESMGERYGIDLRSKSDAQIAEAVIAQEIAKITSRRPKRPQVASDTVLRYEPPAFVSFETAQMRSVFKRLVDSEFYLNGSGEVVAPMHLDYLKFQLGYSTYKMGIGGLHSSEKSKTHLSDDRRVLIDKDVTSYYPSIILNNRYFPPHLGDSFLTVYQDIVNRRVKAKREGDRLTDATLKIVINGSFGKLGSKWSVLYAPNLMLQVTLTGQLSLLMLIERLESAGFSVVSANTDGFVTSVDRNRIDEYQRLCSEWEAKTGFQLEEKVYRALYSRDVSNYIAIQEDGKVKLKGTYRPADISKNPNAEIVSEAVVAYLQHGTDPRDTIRSCTDPRKFVTVQRVTTGASKDGDYLGKVIRSYNATKDYTPIKKGKGGNVQTSFGSKPLMTMGEDLPDDVDYTHYERLAWKSIRKDFSDPADAQMSLFG